MEYCRIENIRAGYIARFIKKYMLQVFTTSSEIFNSSRGRAVTFLFLDHVAEELQDGNLQKRELRIIDGAC